MLAWIRTGRPFRAGAHAVSVYAVDRVKLPAFLSHQEHLMQGLVFGAWKPVDAAWRTAHQTDTTPSSCSAPFCDRYALSRHSYTRRVRARSVRAMTAIAPPPGYRGRALHGT